MNEIALIGKVATEYLRGRLNESHGNGDGVARFLLDRLTGETVATICLNILSDSYLNERVQIRVPKALVQRFGLPDEVMTGYKTTFWRHAVCEKDAIILANTNDDQGPSLRDITTIGAGDLKGSAHVWVKAASEGLLLSDDQFGYWQQALRGLQEANECSLEQFSAYVLLTQTIIERDGVPLIRALGWALPALRLPRDSAYFESIPANGLNHLSKWKNKYQELFNKRGCYLVKQTPTRQFLEKEDLEKYFEDVRNEIPVQHHPVIEAFIDSKTGWTNESKDLAELEWDLDKISSLFLDIKVIKPHLAIRTAQYLEDECSESLTDEDKNYLKTLERRRVLEANEEDKDFFEKYRKEFDDKRSLKADWEKFVYGKPIECNDFYAGLLEAVERLFGQCENSEGAKTLKITTSKKGSKSKWLELNQDIGLFFCSAYRGIEKLTDRRFVNWETFRLFQYDQLIETKDDSRTNTSTAKAAVQIVFFVELTYSDIQGNRQKNEIKLIWNGNPASIGMEQYEDLRRLAIHPFSYSSIATNPISKKGKLQNISLDDVGTLQAVFGQDRGSLISTYTRSEDIAKTFKKNLKIAKDSGRVTAEGYIEIESKWKHFEEMYSKAINQWKEHGLSSEFLLLQSEAYKDLLSSLHMHAQGDVNRIQLWHPIMNIGNIQVEGKKPISIVAPWHPLRLASKAIKARQVAGLINYVLSADNVDFGDSKLFFSDLRAELKHPYYPETAVGYVGQQAHLLSESDTVNDYSLMESPIRDSEDQHTNEDPREASAKVLDLVKRYIALQPHEKTNLSIVLFNSDSARLPESIVTTLTSLYENEDEVRCQVILRHRDSDKLNELYMKMIEENNNDPDTFVASEVSRDFMARLRVEVMADAAAITDDGKPADIVFLQDVISRQSKMVWIQDSIGHIPELINHFPPRWARRRSSAKDDLKSTVYLTCPSQPQVGILYLATLYSMTNATEPERDKLYLPARQISFQNENIRGIFDEAHTLGEWVVNYDDLLERRQLRNQGVKVIKYQQSRTQGPNLIVSSRSKLNLLQVLVKRRLEALDLRAYLTEDDLLKLTEKFIDEANGISGDIVLRAAKRGICAGELIGVVLSKLLIQSEIRSSSVGWFFLDDYAAWLGQKEEQIADILALSPQIKDGKPYLQVLVTEAKYVDARGVSEAKRNSQKQLRDTINRMDSAIFGNPGRLDRDLWLSRLGDMLNDGIEFTQSSELSVEEWREGIRNGTIPIELKGYSQVFVSSTLDAPLDNEQLVIANANHCFQEVFSKELVRELVLAYFRGESIVNIRKKIGDHEPWEIRHSRLPAPRVSFLGSEEEQEESEEFLNTNQTSSKQEDERSDFGENQNQDETEQTEINFDEPNDGPDAPTVDDENVSSWANSGLNDWIQNNISLTAETMATEQWVNQTVTTLKGALISYSLQAKVLGHRLTPNAVVIRLKGSDQLRVEDIEKKKSQLLTTHALDIINIMALPGEIVVSLARPQREMITLADVWKMRKVQENNSGMNMSFVVGIKEIDGELLYLNLGGAFEGLEQHAPHTLIAGATGSGKSVLLQNLILDICATNSPKLARVYLIDPKFGVDYQQLEELPHLSEGIIIEQQRAVQILEFLVEEMDRRYLLFRGQRANNLKDYNNKVTADDKLPLLFLIHDEFAEWMLVDTYKNSVSSIVQRLGVKARAAGIHLIFAAQRPDANVLPVQLRDNLGNRLILRVESIGTSEISLNEKGAEKLLGRGHLAARLQGEPNLIFGQVPFISSEDISKVTEILKN